MEIRRIEGIELENQNGWEVKTWIEIDWSNPQEAEHSSKALKDKVWHITLPSLFVTAVTSSLIGVFLLLLLFGGDFIGSFRNLGFDLLLSYAILFWLLVFIPIKPIQQVDLKNLAQKYMKNTLLS